MQKVFGEETMQKIKDAKILMVGAGGIGCELLKNLVQSGFHNIEIVTFSFFLLKASTTTLYRFFLFVRSI